MISKLLYNCDACGKPNILYQVIDRSLCLSCATAVGSVEQSVDGIPASAMGYTLDNFMTNLDDFIRRGVVNHSDVVRAKESHARAVEIKDMILADKQVGSIFYGQNGLGKTHLSVAIMKAIRDHGLRTELVNAEFFYQRCQEFIKSDYSVEDYIHSFDVDLLVLDDCSFAADTEFFRRTITMLVYHVMDVLGSSMIITTNLTQNALAKMVGDSVIDRVATYRLNQKFTGISMRDVLNPMKVRDNG